VTSGPARGRAQQFREGSWIERCVDRLRGSRTVPAPRLLRSLHEAVLDRWPGDHLVSTLPNGERVRLAARHRTLSWNPDEYRAFRRAIQPGATVFDVGANLGAYTLLFGQWVGANGRVVAFEPSPASQAGLLRHVQMNDLVDRVEIVRAAVTDRVGTADFHVDRFGGASSLYTAGQAAPTTVTVETTTLDAFCAARGLTPNVLKVDVEGAELEVLRGAREVLSSPQLSTFVELHPSVWSARGFSAAEVARELHGLGFAAEPLDPAFDLWSMEGVCARLVRR
jgi:FkbM family methyltransferase